MGEEARVVLRTGSLLLGALVLQLGMVDDLRLFGVHPELLLSVAMASAVALGAERGAVVCFSAGVLTDLFLSGRFGITALAWGMAGYGTGLLAEGVVRASRVVDAALVAGGSAVAIVLYAILGSLLGQGTLADDHLLRIVAIVSLTAAALSPLMLAVSRWAGAPDPRLRPSR